MRMLRTLPGIAAVLAGLNGCAAYQGPTGVACAARPRDAVRVYTQTLPELTYAAIDKITRCLPPDIRDNVAIVVASLTESRRIDQSSDFGNLVADLARSRLVQNRMIVMEPRLRSAMLLRPGEGELMLARDAAKLVAPPVYSAVLTGTYAAGDTIVYVGLKLMRADNGQILAAADFIADRSEGVDELLGIAAPVRRR
jgi:hypothetical protein